MLWSYHFCTCQEERPSLTEEDIQRGSKKWDLHALRRQYLQKKGLNVIETWEYGWWRLDKTTNTVNQHIREQFFYRRSLAAERLLEEIKKIKLFGYVQCDIEAPENLRWKFDNYSLMFKNTLVSMNDIGIWWKTLPKKKDFCLNRGKWWYWASHNKVDDLSLLCCCFIYNWVLFAQKYSFFLSTLQRNTSIALCSQQWTQEAKVTKVQTQKLSQKQWRF